MGIATVTELARTYEADISGRPVAKRTFAVTLTNDTLEGSPPTETELVVACQVDNWGTAHPGIPAIGLRKVTITERFQDSPYHVQLVAEYGPGTSDELLSPTLRPARWIFDAQPSEIPALFYYDGSTRRPLTNSAHDFFTGLTTSEQIIKATISKNYATFPSAQVNAQNSVNSASYLGCPQHSWKVVGVRTEQVVEIYNLVQVDYWATQVEIHYRQSGWNLQLPDVGWNYLAGGQKRRAMVYDFENDEWVASANPVGLDGSGNQTLGVPALLDRRVNPEANFVQLFGQPPS